MTRDTSATNLSDFPAADAVRDNNQTLATSLPMGFNVHGRFRAKIFADDFVEFWLLVSHSEEGPFCLHTPSVLKY